MRFAGCGPRSADRDTTRCVTHSTIVDKRNVSHPESGPRPRSEPHLRFARVAIYPLVFPIDVSLFESAGSLNG
jgi:hypothetical protein